MSMSEAVQFFYDNGPVSWDPKTQTEEEGRAECARELAAAELRMLSGPYHVEIEPEPDPITESDGPQWLVSLWSTEADALCLGSLGSVDCEEDDPYLRVVAAQLALEGIPA